MRSSLLSIIAVVALGMVACDAEEGQDGFETSVDRDAPLITTPPEPEMGAPVGPEAQGVGGAVQDTTAPVDSLRP